jgi:hypothetical protein
VLLVQFLVVEPIVIKLGRLRRRGCADVMMLGMSGWRFRANRKRNCGVAKLEG